MKSYKKLNDFTPGGVNEKLFVRSCIVSINNVGGLDNKVGKRRVEKRRKVSDLKDKRWKMKRRGEREK